MNIKEYIKKKRLLTDGAMGTYFDQLEREDLLCSEEANLSDPDLIRKIHLDYIEKGARLIRCNTFSANQDLVTRLRSRRETWSNLTLSALIEAGYRIACEAADLGMKEEEPVFVAADIGPMAEQGEDDLEKMLNQYYEICDIFLDLGCEIFVLETFPDEFYVLRMAEHIRKQNPKAWILGQFSFMTTGYGSTGFHYTTVLRRAIESGLLDATGLNCGIGSSHMNQFYEKYLKEFGNQGEISLTALPNCGYPQIVRGKAVYSDSVAYFSGKMREIAGKGIQILGGCCGTTPEYIEAIGQWIHEEDLVTPVTILPDSSKDRTREKKEIDNAFIRKLNAGEKVFAVELDPPFDANFGKLLAGARELLGTSVDIITLADSPLARSRADSLLVGSRVKKSTRLQVMPHLSCRDRNRLAIRGGILGAYINDIRNFLIVTGDPVPRSEQDNTSSVFDFNSIKCMRYLKQMNETVFAEDPICYGGALNQDGTNLDAIANRMKKKMEEGCSYFLTQPVYSQQSIEKLEYLIEKTGARVLVGLLPIVSRRNALFLQNEMTGIHVPDEVVAMYKENGNREEWEDVSVSLTLDIMKRCEHLGAGYYIMTPFNRVSLVRRIMKAYEEEKV